MNSLVLAGPNSTVLGKKLSQTLNCNYSELFSDKFPDGEVRIRIDASVKGKTVVLVESMQPNPNDALVRLILTINTAKELGAKKIIVIAPYFAYARQDVRFNPGECVSNKIVARLIEQAGASAFVTLNTHLHRIASLKEIFKIPAKDVLLSEEFASYYSKIRKSKSEVLVVGPDGESGKWAAEIASFLQADSYAFKKKRFSGTKIKNFEVPGLDCKGKDVFLIDDIASTGNTLISVAKILKKQGANRVDCVVTHLLEEQGAKKILSNGIDSLACSNAIFNKYSKIDASKPLAIAIKKIL